MKFLYQGNHRFRFEYRVHNLDYPLHIHNAIEIFCCTAGTTTVQYGDSQQKISAGDIFCAFPNRPHGYTDSHDEEGFIFIVPLKPYLSAFYNTLTKKYPADPVLIDAKQRDPALFPVLQIAYEESNIASAAVMQGYLQVIVGKILSMLVLEEIREGSDETVKAILEFLDANYKQPLTRREIAKAVGYNESYISHIFTKMFKTTLLDYINSLRIYDACEMLMQTEKTVSVIARELGFGSIRSFNRVFLKETGCTPREYRLSRNKR